MIVESTNVENTHQSPAFAKPLLPAVVGSKRYSVIYADPAWEQKAGRDLSGGYKKVDGKQVFNCVSIKSENLPYKTMTVEEIANLDVKSIIEKDAVLFLWVTNKYLFEAKKVIDAWGFKYSTTITWSKKPFGGGMGGTFRVSHETLLFCTRGKVNAKTKIKGTVFEVKRPYVNGYPCHSKKPDFFIEMIEQLTEGNRLELFARQNRNGWDAWGNEVEESINLETSANNGR